MLYAYSGSSLLFSEYNSAHVALSESTLSSTALRKLFVLPWSNDNCEYKNQFNKHKWTFIQRIHQLSHFTNHSVIFSLY